MLSSLWLSAALAGAALAPASSPEGRYFRYEGLCEASAAAVVGPDRFAVASDDSEIVQIYERNRAIPVASVTMSDVTDLEAAAVIGDRLYWITSHSLTKNGKDENERKRLVEAPLSGGTFTATGRQADLCRRIADLLGTPEWPLEASLNIEGMASIEGGDLLLGLRAPLNEGNAAVLRLREPRRLIDGSVPPAGAAAVTDLQWLKLKQRGIRSLERVPGGAQPYLILAGAIGGGDKEPALFWWDGASAEPTEWPILRVRDRLPDEPGLKSRDIVPEALIAWSDGAILILGDNESNCEEGEGQPWFPSLELRP